ncbi:MAG: site-specific integrase [Chloroflexi bacterium]|jgi:integrase|nr:site-specific integrase [Chloroflexota bacterium]
MSGSVKQVGTFKRTGKPRWIARYRGADRQERQKAFRRKIDAEGWLRDRQAEITTGAWIPPERARRLFKSVAAEWLDSHTGKPSTVAGYRSILSCQLLEKFGSRQIGSIERYEIRRFISDLSKTELSANSVRNVLNVIKGICSHAVETGALRSSPAAGLAAPRGERREMVVATDSQIAKIADRVPAHYRVLIFAAAYTGLRAGELAALRVGDLDLMRGRIHVRRAVAEVHGRMETGPPKSGKERTVSVPPFLQNMLTTQVAAAAKDPEALVFTTKDGAQIRISNFYPRLFRPAADAVGLETLRFHDLRHTCVAFLIASGAHPRAIMERLGHSSITVTMDVYGHLLPSLDDELTDALETRFRNAS